MKEQDLNRFVGNRIREERKLRKMSQKEVGERIGVKHNTISQYENATNSPDQESLFNIARVFGIRVGDLFPPMEIEDNNMNFERALRLDKDLDLKDANFLKTLIEKTLSKEGSERDKFLESIKFTVDYYDKMNRD